MNVSVSVSADVLEKVVFNPSETTYEVSFQNATLIESNPEQKQAVVQFDAQHINLINEAEDEDAQHINALQAKVARLKKEIEQLTNELNEDGDEEKEFPIIDILHDRILRRPLPKDALISVQQNETSNNIIAKSFDETNVNKYGLWEIYVSPPTTKRSKKLKFYNVATNNYLAIDTTGNPVTSPSDGKNTIFTAERIVKPFFKDLYYLYSEINGEREYLYCDLLLCGNKVSTLPDPPLRGVFYLHSDPWTMPYSFNVSKSVRMMITDKPMVCVGDPDPDEYNGTIFWAIPDPSTKTVKFRVTFTNRDTDEQTYLGVKKMDENDGSGYELVTTGASTDLTSLFNYEIEDDNMSPATISWTDPGSDGGVYYMMNSDEGKDVVYAGFGFLNVGVNEKTYVMSYSNT